MVWRALEAGERIDSSWLGGMPHVGQWLERGAENLLLGCPGVSVQRQRHADHAHAEVG